jgi:hypothetical protein
MTTTALLRKAAAIIREHAQALRSSHCTPPDFDLETMEPEVREVYDDEVATAAALDGAAREIETLGRIAALGLLALAELDARKDWLAKRRAFLSWLDRYHAETGEWFDRDQCEADERAAFDELLASRKAAAAAMRRARGKFRCAVTRAKP